VKLHRIPDRSTYLLNLSPLGQHGRRSSSMFSTICCPPPADADVDRCHDDVAQLGLQVGRQSGPIFSGASHPEGPGSSGSMRSAARRTHLCLSPSSTRSSGVVSSIRLTESSRVQRVSQIVGDDCEHVVRRAGRLLRSRERAARWSATTIAARLARSAAERQIGNVVATTGPRG